MGALMLIDEAEDLFDLPERGGAAVPQLLNESTVSGRGQPKRGRGHPRLRKEALDARQNLCLSDHEAILIGYVQFDKRKALEISRLDNQGCLCLDTDMSKGSQSQRTASPVYDRLIALKPESWTEAEWARRAGVNMSFFTDLKKGTKPTLEKVERLVQAAGRTMPELYGAGRAPLKDVLDADRARAAAIEIFRALGRDEFQAELLAKYILSKSRMSEAFEASDDAADTSPALAVGAKDLVRLLDIQ